MTDNYSSQDSIFTKPQENIPQVEPKSIVDEVDFDVH